MKRLRVRAILITVLLLLIPVALHQGWDYIETRRLVREVEAVIARGEPVTDDQAFPFAASTEKDAGSYYIAAGLITHHTRPDPVFPVLVWLAGAGPQPSEDGARALHAYAEKSRQALELADKAALLNFSRLPPGTEYGYRTSHVIGLARLLEARTLSLSVLDEGDAAVGSAMSALKLRRAVRELRWPLTWAVSHETPAILSLSHPSAAALVELQRALQDEDARDDVMDGLLADRAHAIQAVWQRYYGPDAAAPRDVRPRMRSLMRAIQRPLITHRGVRMMRRWADLIEAARKPWPERLRAVEAVATKHGPLGESQAELMFLLPPYEVVTPRILVTDRTALTAVAIERFRRDNGMLPVALTDLVPRYLARVPQDPYSGASLLYESEATSYTVYSVGPDRADNGGDLTSELLAAQKRGYGPRSLRGLDAGVRVLLRPY
jgi:hypothetical protein